MKRTKDITQQIIFKFPLQSIKMFYILYFSWKTIKYFSSHTNHPSLAALSITDLYVQIIVFVNSIIIMNIRMVASIHLIFYYKT
jgi:hypothetical protein